MDRSTLGILAIIAALAGAGLYLLSASYEQQVAELRRQLEHASQREAASAAAAKAAYMSAVETAVAEAKAQAQKAAAERAAAQKAAAEVRATAEALAAQRAALAARAEEAAAAARMAEARRTPAAPSSAQQLYEQAQALEEEGKGSDAVKVYLRAARSGSGRAALRLGAIYDKGIPGVSRDYAESLKWYNAARVLGEDVPLAKTR